MELTSWALGSFITFIPGFFSAYELGGHYDYHGYNTITGWILTINGVQADTRPDAVDVRGTHYLLSGLCPIQQPSEGECVLNHTFYDPPSLPPTSDDLPLDNALPLALILFALICSMIVVYIHNRMRNRTAEVAVLPTSQGSVISSILRDGTFADVEVYISRDPTPEEAQQAILASKEAEIAQLDAAIRDLSESFETNVSEGKAVQEELLVKIESLEASLSEKDQAMRTAEDRASSLDTELGTVQEQLLAKIESLEASLSEKDQAMRTAEDRASSLGAELATVQTAVRTQKNELRNAEESREKDGAELLSCRKSLHEAEIRLGDTENTLDEVSNKLSTYQNDLDDKKVELKVANESRESSLLKLSSCENELKETKTKLQNVRKTRDNIQESASKDKAALARKEQQIQQLMHQKKASDEDAQATRVQLLELMSRLTQTEKERDERHGQIDTLMGEHKSETDRLYVEIEKHKNAVENLEIQQAQSVLKMSPVENVSGMTCKIDPLNRFEPLPEHTKKALKIFEKSHLVLITKDSHSLQLAFVRWPAIDVPSTTTTCLIVDDRHSRYAINKKFPNKIPKDKIKVLLRNFNAGSRRFLSSYKQSQAEAANGRFNPQQRVMNRRRSVGCCESRLQMGKYDCRVSRDEPFLGASIRVDRLDEPGYLSDHLTLNGEVKKDKNGVKKAEFKSVDIKANLEDRESIDEYFKKLSYPEQVAYVAWFIHEREQRVRDSMDNPHLDPNVDISPQLTAKFASYDLCLLETDFFFKDYETRSYTTFDEFEFAVPPRVPFKKNASEQAVSRMELAAPKSGPEELARLLREYEKLLDALDMTDEDLQCEALAVILTGKRSGQLPSPPSGCASFLHRRPYEPIKILPVDKVKRFHPPLLNHAYNKIAMTYPLPAPLDPRGSILDQTPESLVTEPGPHRGKGSDTSEETHPSKSPSSAVSAGSSPPTSGSQQSSNPRSKCTESPSHQTQASAKEGTMDTHGLSAITELPNLRQDESQERVLFDLFDKIATKDLYSSKFAARPGSGDSLKNSASSYSKTVPSLASRNSVMASKFAAKPESCVTVTSTSSTAAYSTPKPPSASKGGIMASKFAADPDCGATPAASSAPSTSAQPSSPNNSVMSSRVARDPVNSGTRSSNASNPVDRGHRGSQEKLPLFIRSKYATDYNALSSSPSVSQHGPLNNNNFPSAAYPKQKDTPQRNHVKPSQSVSAYASAGVGSRSSANALTTSSAPVQHQITSLSLEERMVLASQVPSSAASMRPASANNINRPYGSTSENDHQHDAGGAMASQLLAAIRRTRTGGISGEVAIRGIRR